MLKFLAIQLKESTEMSTEARYKRTTLKLLVLLVMTELPNS